MKKKVNFFLFAFILLLFFNSHFFNTNYYFSKTAEAPIDSKVYNSISLNDNFSTNGLDVVLTKEASLDFNKAYTLRDFSEINGLISIMDLTQAIAKNLKNQPSIKTHNNTSLINANNFRKQLRLRLKDNTTKVDILRYIKLLESRNDIRAVDVHTASGDYSSGTGKNNRNAGYFEPAWAREVIKAEEALSRANGVPIAVGVIDSGIDGTHTDLAPLIHTPDDGGTVLHRNFLNPTIPHGIPEHIPSSGGSGHGTFVAGVIASAFPNVRLVSLKVGDEYGPQDHIIKNAVIFAAEHGIPVLNCSLYLRDSTAISGLSDAIELYNGVFITSANNNDMDNDLGIGSTDAKFYPAAFTFENMISVGATTMDYANGVERRATTYDWGYPWSSFGSNYGKNTVHLFAPGTDIVSTYPVEEYVDNSEKHVAPGYYRDSGTSYSAPLVAATAAMILSIDPFLDTILVKEAIMKGVDVLPSLADDYSAGGKTCITSGRLNMLKSILSIKLNLIIIPTYDFYVEEYIDINDDDFKLVYFKYDYPGLKMVQLCGSSDIYMEIYENNVLIGTVVGGQNISIVVSTMTMYRIKLTYNGTKNETAKLIFLNTTSVVDPNSLVFREVIDYEFIGYFRPILYTLYFEPTQDGPHLITFSIPNNTSGHTGLFLSDANASSKSIFISTSSFTIDLTVGRRYFISFYSSYNGTANMNLIKI